MQITYDRTKALIEGAGMTINSFEEMVGFSNGSIKRWIKGACDASKLCLVADHFGVSVDYLLGRTDDPKTYEVSKGLSHGATRAVNFIEFKNPTNEQGEIIFSIIQGVYLFNSDEGWKDADNL